jgi:hypothetical protein
MRTVLLGVTAVLALLAATCLSAQAGSVLSAARPSPATPGFPLGAMSSRLATAPTIGLRAPVRTALAGPCDGKFDVVSSPSAAGDNTLFGVSAINANDVWAVGISSNSPDFVDRTLAEHWNGNSWVIVPTPNPSAFQSDLNSVTAIATNDVWAVGTYQVDSAGTVVHSFAEHWNGSAWALVTSTFNPASFTALYGVTATAHNDVWAVGFYHSAGAYFTLAEHWNGSAWSQFSTQNPSTQTNLLFAVSAFNSNDVWAVGDAGASGTTPSQSLAEHWNGSTWSTVSTPNVGVGATNAIIGVTALEANHAVGVGESGSNPSVSTAWDLLAGGGSTAQVEAAPGSGGSSFLAVARSGSSVWGVGYWASTTASARQTLVISATWDSGTHTLTWAGSPAPSDSPSAIDNALFAVAAVTPSVFWAAGRQQALTTDQTLTELYCGVHFNVSAPGTAIKGVPFSVTVTATNADASTATRYVGTVHFSSTDPLAILPGDYTFTPGDNGSHTFSSVVLNSPYTETITVNDTATTFVKGSVVIHGHCAGACQSTAGTPGSRGVQPGPTPASPGGRAVLPGPSPGTGIRMPLRIQSGAGSRLAAVVGQAASAALSATSTVAAGGGVNPRSSAKSAPRITEAELAVGERAPDRLVAAPKAEASGGADSATSVELAISLSLLVLALLALQRLRSREEFSVHD